MKAKAFGIVIPLFLALGFFAGRLLSSRFDRRAMTSEVSVPMPETGSTPKALDTSQLIHEVTRGSQTTRNYLRLERMAYEVPISQIPSLLESSRAEASQLYRFREILFRRWAEFDPQAAWRMACGDPERRNFATTRDRQVVASAWARRDLAGSLRAIMEGLDELDWKDQLAYSALGSAAKTDPLAALAALQSLPSRSTQEHAAAPIFEAWHRRDPESALRWMEGKIADPREWPAIAKALEALQRRDPKAGLAMLARLPTDADSSRTLCKGAMDTWLRESSNFYAEPLSESLQTFRDPRLVGTLTAPIAMSLN